MPSIQEFPIVSVARHPLVEARDILVAELDVDGHPLHVYVNHWKSGASNPEREPVRVGKRKGAARFAGCAPQRKILPPISL